MSEVTKDQVSAWVSAQDLAASKLLAMSKANPVDILMKMGDYLRGFTDGAFYAFCAPKAAESPATDRQQLKAAIALVRKAAHESITGVRSYNDLMGYLETIEQRAAV